MNDLLLNPYIFAFFLWFATDMLLFPAISKMGGGGHTITILDFSTLGMVLSKFMLYFVFLTFSFLILQP